MQGESVDSGVDAVVVAALMEKVAQLEAALASRVVIEQAKGMVAVRDRVAVEVAFERLRRIARTSRRSVGEVAKGVVAAHELGGRFSPR